MYHHIMVPLDGSELAECVFPHVETIAAGCGVSKVTLITGLEPFHLTRSEEVRKEMESFGVSAAENYLSQVMNRLSLGNVTLQAEVIVGPLVESLVDYASGNDVDLIVIATHGRSGIGRWVWGSTADRILRAACAPVLMVRAPGCVPGA